MNVNNERFVIHTTIDGKKQYVQSFSARANNAKLPSYTTDQKAAKLFDTTGEAQENIDKIHTGFDREFNIQPVQVTMRALQLQD